MKTPRIARSAVIAAVALGIGAASPAWADGWHDGDGGGAAAIIGLAAGLIAAPLVYGQARVVAPAPVYAPPPVVYAPPPPAYVYAPPTYVAAPAYYGRPEWHGDGHRDWHHDRWHGEGDR